MHIRGKKSPPPFAYHQHKTLQWLATGNKNLSKLQGSASVSADNFKHRAKSRKKSRQNKEAQIINHSLLVFSAKLNPTKFSVSGGRMQT
jgi:hypothetical protein